jgi:hypothetical protein
VSYLRNKCHSRTLSRKADRWVGVSGFAFARWKRIHPDIRPAARSRILSSRPPSSAPRADLPVTKKKEERHEKHRRPSSGHNWRDRMRAEYITRAPIKPPAVRVLAHDARSLSGRLVLFLIGPVGILRPKLDIIELANRLSSLIARPSRGGPGPTGLIGRNAGLVAEPLIKSLINGSCGRKIPHCAVNNDVCRLRRRLQATTRHRYYGPGAGRPARPLRPGERPRQVPNAAWTER